MDLDVSENIDYLEFITAVFNYKKHLNDDLVKKMFDLIDTDQSG